MRGVAADESTDGRFKHGFGRRKGRPPEFGVWLSMKDRCDRPTVKAYKNYGGRGIVVCPEWYDFARFYARKNRMLPWPPIHSREYLHLRKREERLQAVPGDPDASILRKAKEMIQGSDEWKAAKTGKVSASRISDVLAKGQGKSRSAYLNELAVERLTGVFTEGYKSADMIGGTELEPRACAAYEFTRGIAVETVGFIGHPRIAFAGASPDGRVGPRGLVQFKAPKATTHLEYLDGATLPKDYRDQMQWEMATDERDWCDFASFHPDFPPGMDLHVRRVERDAAYITEIETEVRKFLAELDTKVAALRQRYGVKEAA